MKLTISLPAKRIILILAAIATYLALHSIAGKHIEASYGETPPYLVETLVRVFNINREASVPTWFSSSLLLCSALLMAIIAYGKHLNRDRYTRHWWGLATIFLYLSLDESAELHEKLTQPFQEIFNASGFLYFAWVIAGWIFVLLFAFAYFRFWLHLPKVSRVHFAASALLYVGGVLIIEGISANQWYLDNGTSLFFSAIGTTEELFEMLGVITLIYSLLYYLQGYAREIVVYVKVGAEQPVMQSEEMRGQELPTG